MKRYIWQKRLAETGYAVTNPRSQIKHSCLLFVKAKDKITDNSIKCSADPLWSAAACPVLDAGAGDKPPLYNFRLVRVKTWENRQ